MHVEPVYKDEKKITSSSGIVKTIYPDVRYLLLFGKKKFQSFEISC